MCCLHITLKRSKLPLIIKLRWRYVQTKPEVECTLIVHPTPSNTATNKQRNQWKSLPMSFLSGDRKKSFLCLPEVSQNCPNTILKTTGVVSNKSRIRHNFYFFTFYSLLCYWRWFTHRNQSVRIKLHISATLQCWHVEPRHWSNIRKRTWLVRSSRLPSWSRTWWCATSIWWWGRNTSTSTILTSRASIHWKRS